MIDVGQRARARKAIFGTKAQKMTINLLPSPEKLEPQVVSLLADMQRVLKLGAKSRAKFVESLKRSLEEIFRDLDIKPQDLSAKSYEELAGLFLEMIERQKLAKYSFKELRDKEIGLKGNFAGELFELLAKNHRIFQEMLIAEARKQLADMIFMAEKELNNIKAKKERNNLVVNARGRPGQEQLLLEHIKKLGHENVEIRKATDIWTMENGEWKMFTDFAYVATFDVGGETKVLYLVGVEAKVPGVAWELPDQIGDVRSRFFKATMLRISIDGVRQPPIKPENILFGRSVGSNMFGVSMTRRTADWGYFMPTTRRDLKSLNPVSANGVEVAGKDVVNEALILNRYSFAMKVDSLKKLATLPFRLLKELE